MIHARIKNAFITIFNHFKRSSRKRKLVYVAVLVALLLFAIRLGKNTESPEEATAKYPVVYTGSVRNLEQGERTTFVGAVRAVNEVQIQAETGGRITSVRVQPGDHVEAGTILATLENSTQEAALLQAQGLYEIALAGAAQGNVVADDAKNTLTSAKNNAITAYRNAYTSANSVVINDIDIFFSDPDNERVPGVKLNIYFKDVIYLNNERIKLQSILREWKESSIALGVSDDIDQKLIEAEHVVQNLISMVDIFIEATRSADASEVIDGAPVTIYTDRLTTTRATLNGILTTLSSAQTTLASARENIKRTEIGSTQSTDVSLANAQVKQALGTLKSAQANYEKTIFRTPIAGTVNSFPVHAGDFVSVNTHIAEVANNNALQISIYVGEADLNAFSVGDTVKINGIATGTVTSIAPAIDSITQKTEVRIGTESSELTNGSSVTVALAHTIKNENSGPLLIPITAVKFNATSGVVFTITDEKLVANKVEIGSITGSFVTITKGIDVDTTFVLDARGLSEGQHVEAIQR